jgi:hypothetical protein
MTEIRASGIREQDVDLLLWEELVASPEFLSWFLEEAGLSDRGDLATVARSVTAVNGESDLELELRSGSATIKILIENKIDAPLQPLQAARYRDRAAAYLQQTRCTAARTVVVAPTAYFGDSEDCLGFDSRVTYEAILAWFEQAPGLGARGLCKVVLLREALEHGRWTMVPDKIATEFWRLYWERASTIAPDLRTPEPKDRPATSSFIFFRPFGLAPGVSLLHKLPYGNVDLQFAQMGDRLEEITQRYGRYLESDMRVDRATRSGVIRITVPRIDMCAPFLTSKAAVEAGIQAATRLLALSKRVRP